MAGVDFQVQITSIMEALANAAVAEICKVIDAVIQLEFSQSLKENELLKQKMREMERAILHTKTHSASADFTPLKRPVFSKTDQSALKKHGGILDQAIIIKDEPTDPEDEPITLIVKEEKPICGDSSFGLKLSAKDNTSQNERACTAGAALFCAGAPEGGKVTVRAEATVQQVQLNDTVKVVNKGVDHSEAIVHVGIRTACEGTENAGSAFDQKHVQQSAQWSCSNADLKPDFLIIEPSPADEILDGQVECDQRETDDPGNIRYRLQYGDRCSPSSKKHFLAFFGSFSGTSREQISWNRNIGGPQTLHGDTVLNCCLCGKTFSHAKQLKLHERVHTEEKVYRCGRCGRQFPQLCRLKRHERVHTGEKPFRCTKCGKHFAHANNLKVHQSVHTGEKQFGCVQCGKSFSFLSNLIRHKAVHAAK